MIRLDKRAEYFTVLYEEFILISKLCNSLYLVLDSSVLNLGSVEATKSNLAMDFNIFTFLLCKSFE